MDELCFYMTAKIYKLCLTVLFCLLIMFCQFIFLANLSIIIEIFSTKNIPYMILHSANSIFSFWSGKRHNRTRHMSVCMFYMCTHRYSNVPKKVENVLHSFMICSQWKPLHFYQISKLACTKQSYFNCDQWEDDILKCGKRGLEKYSMKLKPRYQT